jgi:hypothetical protein
MPWSKGQSGNPGGRPKSKPITEALLKELKAKGPGKLSHTQEMAWRLVQLAIAGDVAAAKLVLSYVDGLPIQNVEVGGPDGQDLTFTIHIARADDGHSDAD